MPDTTIETTVPIDDSSGESEDDVIGRLGAQRANVSATDWTIETIVTQMVKGRIDLDPSFQRRAAWTTALKSRFIESTLLAYPIPQIVLAEKLDKPGHFIVIDGKQRLLSLRQFYAGLTGYDKGGFDSYRLTTVTVIESIKNFTIERLQRERPELFDAFETHTIRTVVIRNWESEDFLYTLFLRLNTGSVPLSPQELRQALVPGPFVKWIDDVSGASPGLQRLLGNKGPDRRMVDAEVLVRLIGMHSGKIEYRGNLKDFLDKVCGYYNAHWAQYEVELMNTTQAMEQAISAAYDIFGDGNACRKWNGSRYERFFNRALFDVEIGALLNSESLREKAVTRRDSIVEAFRELCTDDSVFVRTISTTTKTIEAFQERYQRWYKKFELVIDEKLEWPASLPLPLNGI